MGNLNGSEMTKTNQKIFVFVVCGARAHIETLHLSLQALRKYSRNEIWILTDARRNEISIHHANIIDAKTPTEFNHHQASIYLKTGIHKFLPAGNSYCYLDTDVIALNQGIDEIFEDYKPPITFCTDVTKLNKFSPFAVNCNCFANFERDKTLPAFYDKEFTENVLPQIEFIDCSIHEIERRVAATKESEWVYRLHKLKYWLGGKFYVLDKDYKLEKDTGLWFTAAGKRLKYEATEKDVVAYIQNKTGFRFNPSTNQWYRRDGSSVSQLYCNHLLEKIQNKFGIAISPDDWQHWNGGVFLFDDNSHDFLNCWHEMTMQVFQDKNWRTRDQGTLAATAWKFDLQNHFTLPLSFNFIADYELPLAHYPGNLKFKTATSEKIIAPKFVHVYKNWGDMNWQVWKDIFNHISQDGK